MPTFEFGKVVEVKEILQEPDHRPDATWTVTANAMVAGQLVQCAFKAVDSHRLANELTASWLARKVGMRLVLQAMLLEDADGLVGSAIGPSFPADHFRRGLGTQFQDAPVFEKPDYEGLVALAADPEVHQIIVFDVLIANTDRVDKNLLRAGSFIVFDHDKAFTGQTWSADRLRDAAGVTPNSHFEQYLQFADPTAEEAILEVASSWQRRLAFVDTAELDALVSLDILTSDDVEGLKNFIRERSVNLRSLVQAVIDRNRI